MSIGGPIDLLGSEHKAVSAFTFYFKQNEHGLWPGSAYNFEDGLSTFIVGDD